MRTDLAEDPAVIDMAAALGDVDEDIIVGKLHRLWSWADRQSRDGHANGVTETWIDRYIRCDGFARAMVSVGWLVIENKAVTFPNFDRHNGETAKTRALGTKRKQKQRASVPQSVPEMSRIERDKSETREEKRREENNPPLPPASGGKQSGRVRREKVTFPAFIEACRDAGEKAIPAADPIFQFADDTGIHREYLELAWREFARKHRESQRLQKDWRAHFRDAVRRNWFKLWWFPEEGRCDLTTAGVQLKRERDAESSRRAEAEHEDAA
ncbi:hypothetical protein [Lysobacter fragariae]